VEMMLLRQLPPEGTTHSSKHDRLWGRQPHWTNSLSNQPTLSTRARALAGAPPGHLTRGRWSLGPFRALPGPGDVARLMLKLSGALPGMLPLPTVSPGDHTVRAHRTRELLQSLLDGPFTASIWLNALTAPLSTCNAPSCG